MGLLGERGFVDRRDAGRRLGERLANLAEIGPVVIGLPRGGVPVAFEVARALRAPLEVLVARKIGAPGNPELGIGAVAEDGVRVLNERIVRALQLSPEELEHATARAEAELAERARRYREARAPVDVKGRTVVVVDDGLATGGTARAALRALRRREPAHLVLAVPVGAGETIEALRGECDEVVCLLVPEMMAAIGYWYEDFGQTSDEEVRDLLTTAREAHAAADWSAVPAPLPGSDGSGRREVRIPLGDGGAVVGDLALPQDARGLVVFAHGSGSSRHSPRNRDVARTLNHAGLATLLIDLLTPEEEIDRANVFDVELLADRLVAATRWVREQPELVQLPLGYFASSTGAAAALWAAAELGEEVQAVVSRGGRPDLAMERLDQVRAPTLLIVGGSDRMVLHLNCDACNRMRCTKEVRVVEGASHLFEEPGALARVARLALAWFIEFLGVPALAR